MPGPSRSPGFSIAAQLRYARAQAKRLARKKAERDLVAAKERLRVAELEAQNVGILARGKPKPRQVPPHTPGNGI